MKKKILAVLLATAMVAGLAVGCGKSSDSNTETKTEDTKKQRVMAHLRWQLTICQIT